MTNILLFNMLMIIVHIAVRRNELYKYYCTILNRNTIFEQRRVKT